MQCVIVHFLFTMTLKSIFIILARNLVTKLCSAVSFHLTDYNFFFHRQLLTLKQVLPTFRRGRTRELYQLFVLVIALN